MESDFSMCFAYLFDLEDPEDSADILTNAINLKNKYLNRLIKLNLNENNNLDELNFICDQSNEIEQDDYFDFENEE
jgi:hypothetical protein